jgi:hypothetical protein
LLVLRRCTGFKIALGEVMKFIGSRNFCAEQVDDKIWFGEPGTKIVVEILEENKISVEYVND